MITMQIRGARDVEKILTQIAPRHAEALVKQTVGAIASEITKNAKREMNFTGPWSTGRMKRMTKKRTRRTRRGIIQNDIVVGKAAFYWRFYEYGDGTVKRRRMFGKALGKMRPVLGQRFEKLFLQKLERRLVKARNGPRPKRR